MPTIIYSITRDDTCNRITVNYFKAGINCGYIFNLANLANGHLFAKICTC